MPRVDVDGLDSFLHQILYPAHLLRQDTCTVLDRVDDDVSLLVFSTARTHSHYVLFTCEHPLEIQELGMVGNELYLFLETALLLGALHLTECLAHDSNKHVHEDNIAEENGESKHRHSIVSQIPTLSPPERIEVAHSSCQIHHDEGVDAIKSSMGVEVGLTRATVFQQVIQYVEEVSKGAHDDEDHEHKRPTIGDRLLYELHVVSERREQPHPVEDLDPHDELSECSYGIDQLGAEYSILPELVYRKESEESRVEKN